MSRLEDLLAAVLALVLLVIAGWFGVQHYGAGRYSDGYAAAVAAGKEQHDRDATAALKTESDLRAQLRAKDADAIEQEHTYEISLEVAQRRVRDGTDRLRCPTASAVPAAASAEDRPAAGGPAADGQGPELVPDAAAALLGDGGDVAELVRRYQRVVDRFEACRAVNAK